MRRLNLFAARGLQGVESAREEEFVARDLKGLKDFSVDTFEFLGGNGFLNTIFFQHILGWGDIGMRKLCFCFSRSEIVQRRMMLQRFAGQRGSGQVAKIQDF